MEVIRRLPVYLVLDTSNSMHGAPIEAVREGMRIIISQLRKDPQAIETVYIGVITFDSDARQIVPLTDVLSFTEPQLEVGGSTALGCALRTLCRCVDAEVRTGDAQRKGDWKPMVFLMTDGEPTDDWESAIPEVKKRSWGAFVACGAGPRANTEPLKKITSTVLKLHETQDFSQFFAWVSSSIKAASASMDLVLKDAGAAPALPLSPLPPAITIVP